MTNDAIMIDVSQIQVRAGRYEQAIKLNVRDLLMALQKMKAGADVMVHADRNESNLNVVRYLDIMHTASKSMMMDVKELIDRCEKVNIPKRDIMEFRTKLSHYARAMRDERLMFHMDVDVSSGTAPTVKE
jgi:hypothetical protein